MSTNLEWHAGPAGEELKHPEPVWAACLQDETVIAYRCLDQGCKPLGLQS